jgi:predicted TIM-barrel enzyme
MDCIAAGRPVVAIALGEVEPVVKVCNGGPLAAPDDHEILQTRLLSGLRT